MQAKFDFCAHCGKWIGTSEGSIRLSKDGNAEIICNDCIEVEQKRSASSPVDMSIAKLVSA